jgi:hypothetical protein
MDVTETKLCKLLDCVVSNGGTLETASQQAGFGRKYVWKIIKENPVIEWRSEGARPFAEHVTAARKMARVKNEQHMRGVKINGEVQYTLDPWLLEQFGFPDDPDAKDLAELSGYPQYPFALDANGRKIPLLSARFPRPQRPHRNRISPPPMQANGQSSHAGDRIEHKAAGIPWTPDCLLPAYHRAVRTPATPPIVHIPSEASPKVVSPLVADLRERLARGPANPRPVDNRGHLMIPHISTGQRADDPPENGA